MTALNAVNNAATQEQLTNALTTYAATLNLDISRSSDFANLNNPGETGRENGVIKDVFYSKPQQGGYTVRTLEATFERAVQSRMVIKQVMGKMYNASSANALGNVIATNFYSNLKADLISAKNVYSYQGSAPIGDENTGLIKFLGDSLTVYNSLSTEDKLAVNEAVFEDKDTIAKSWTAFHTAITDAIANVRN